MEQNQVKIPELLAEKYPNWGDRFPEILQIDEDMNIIKVWRNKKEIVEFYHKKIQGLDLALRKRCRFIGYFWIIKILYEKEGIRPIITEKRNSPIYAYDPPEYICENCNDYKISDFYSEEHKSKFRFIGRFNNSVIVGEHLDLSVTNIRRVAKGEIPLHKGYFFSFIPIYDIHKISSDILELLEKKDRFGISEEEIVKLNDLIVDFKQEFDKYRDSKDSIISDIDKKVAKMINYE